MYFFNSFYRNSFPTDKRIRLAWPAGGYGGQEEYEYRLGESSSGRTIGHCALQLHTTVNRVTKPACYPSIVIIVRQLLQLSAICCLIFLRVLNLVLFPSTIYIHLRKSFIKLTEIFM